MAYRTCNMDGEVVEFLVKERSEAELVAIRKALNNERICAG